jgi:hypothetical protein
VQKARITKRPLNNEQLAQQSQSPSEEDATVEKEAQITSVSPRSGSREGRVRLRCGEQTREKKGRGEMEEQAVQRRTKASF